MINLNQLLETIQSVQFKGTVKENETCISQMVVTINPEKVKELVTLFGINVIVTKMNLTYKVKAGKLLLKLVDMGLDVPAEILEVYSALSLKLSFKDNQIIISSDISMSEYNKYLKQFGITLEGECEYLIDLNLKDLILALTNSK